MRKQSLAFSLNDHVHVSQLGGVKKGVPGPCAPNRKKRHLKKARAGTHPGLRKIKKGKRLSYPTGEKGGLLMIDGPPETIEGQTVTNRHFPRLGQEY